MTRNARLGLLLFSIYLVFYAGFVFINAYAASWMELTPAAGVNLAIWYGFGLIFGALFLAIIYGILCSRGEDTLKPAIAAGKSSETHDAGPQE